MNNMQVGLPFSELKDISQTNGGVASLNIFPTLLLQNDLSIYNKDMTGIVKNDTDACKLVKEGAKLAGYDVPYKTVSLGATDAAAISRSKSGIKATSFAAMDPAPARYYHTRLDTHENLDLKTIEASLDICLNTLFLYDEKGLDV